MPVTQAERGADRSPAGTPAFQPLPGTRLPPKGCHCLKTLHILNIYFMFFKKSNHKIHFWELGNSLLKKVWILILHQMDQIGAPSKLEVVIFWNLHEEDLTSSEMRKLMDSLPEISPFSAQF